MLEIYDLENESVKVVHQDKIITSKHGEGVRIGAVKFITESFVTVPNTMVLEEEVLTYLEKFEVAILYRNKSNMLNQLKYEIRHCIRLCQIKFSMD